MSRSLFFSLSALLLSTFVVNNAFAQVDEMKLIEQIAELQQQLASDQIPERDAAEKKLIEIGVDALDHLEPPNDETPSDTVKRLGRIRLKLETLAVERVTKRSELTLKGELALKDVLSEILIKTENRVDLYPGAPEELTNQMIKLDFEKASFWEVINSVCDQASLTSNPFQSDQGVLRLVPMNLQGGKKPKSIPRDNSGIFETAVTQVVASKNLMQPSLDYTNVQLRIRWEPRISPIAISLPAKSVKIIDEFDQNVKVSNAEAVFSGTVNTDTPELEFSIPLQSIDRQVETLKSLTCELNTILPGRLEKFKFKNIGRLEQGLAQTKGGVTVAYEGLQKNQDLFGVLVAISFDDPGQALESHLNWVYENKFEMLDDQAEAHLPLATETAGRTKEKITMIYYYADDPSAWTMSYETPAAIVSVPIKITLKDIPLP
ncbi:MAG: hypothetical protein AAFN77_00640 [Planctomycetota bacterium]